MDVGDLLVLRDLLELCNYNIKDKWSIRISEPNWIKYLNIGSLLLNVKELKNHIFWNKYDNRNLKIIEQHKHYLIL